MSREVGESMSKRRNECCTDVNSVMLQMTHVRQASLVKIIDVDAKSEASQPTTTATSTCKHSRQQKSDIYNA